MYNEETARKYLFTHSSETLFIIKHKIVLFPFPFDDFGLLKVKGKKILTLFFYFAMQVPIPMRFSSCLLCRI